MSSIFFSLTCTSVSPNPGRLSTWPIPVFASPSSASSFIHCDKDPHPPAERTQSTKGRCNCSGGLRGCFQYCNGTRGDLRCRRFRIIEMRRSKPAATVVRVNQMEEVARGIATKLRQEGHMAYFAGGC